MKKLTLSALITGLLISISAHAASQSTASDNRMSYHERTLVGLCEAVRSNSKLRLTLALKRARVSYPQMQKGLLCNGKSPMTFAMQNGAKNNARLIEKRTLTVPKDAVAKSLYYSRLEY